MKRYNILLVDDGSQIVRSLEKFFNEDYQINNGTINIIGAAGLLKKGKEERDQSTNLS